MKILIITNDFDMLINFRGHIIKRLISEGHELILAGPKSSTIIPFDCLIHNFNIRGRDIGILNSIKEFINIHQIINQYKPIIIFPFQMKVFILTCLNRIFFKGPKIKFILSGMGNGWDISLKSKIILNLLFKPSINICNSIYVLNKRDLDYVGAMCRKRKNIHLLPGEGLDLNIFKYIKPRFSDRMNFLFIGRTIVPKGIKVFIEAALKFSDGYPGKASFSIVGGANKDDPEYFDVKSYLEKSQNYNIQYLGKRSDVADIIAKSNFVVIPSYMNEGLPRVALESLCLGRPIICTDVPGLADIASFGVDSIRIDKNSIDSLVMAFEKAVQMDEEKIIEMGINGTNKIINNYSNEHIQKIIIETIGE